MSSGSATERRQPEEPYVDREQIEGLMAAAGLEGAKDILDAFWRSTDRLLAALEDQLAAADLVEASRTAHSLKGSAMNVGALRFSLSARTIEEACKASDRAGAEALLPEARDRYAKTVSAFSGVFVAKR